MNIRPVLTALLVQLSVALAMAQSTSTPHSSTSVAQGNGWTRVTDMPTSANQYFYALYEHGHEAWGVQTMNATHQTGTAMVLRDNSDPQTQPSARWILIPRATDRFVMVNSEQPAAFLQTEWDKPWFWHTSDNGAGDASWGEVRLHSLPESGTWQLEQAKYASYLGPWDVSIVCGNEFAGNRTQAEAPQFDLYQILRGRLFANSVTASQLASASATNPIDVTYLITNADAELRSTLGWDIVGMETQSNTAFTAKHATHYFQRWQPSGGLPNSRMSQTIAGLPNGEYRLTASAYYAGTGASIYANADATEVGAAGTYAVTTKVTDGALTIGGRLVGGTANYLCFDDFHLYYIGGADVEQTEDWTDHIVNPDFEDRLTGWTNDGFQSQTNNAFGEKHGSVYCEKWVSAGGTVAVATIEQTLSHLAAGTYTLTADAQNIQEGSATSVQTGAYIFAGDNQAEFGLPGRYSVTVTTADGTLRIGAMTRSATGNYVCVDNFRLVRRQSTDYATLHAQMDAYVQASIAISQHKGTPEEAELDAARQVVATLSTQQTTEGVAEAMQRLQTAIYDYQLSLASSADGIDMTDHIVNPDFEEKLSGWDGPGFQSQSNNDFTGKHLTTYAESWTPSTGRVADITLSQRILVPNGRYRLSASSHNINQQTAGTLQTGCYLFGEQTEAAANGKRVYSGGYKVQADTHSVEFVAIEGQALIGFRTRSCGGNWVAVDNFTLIYIGRDEQSLMDALGDRIGRAETLSGRHMNGERLSVLLSAIAAAREVGSTKGMEPVAIALREAMEAAESSADEYAALLSAIQAAEARYDAGRQGAASLQTSIDAARAVYNNTESQSADFASAQTMLQKAVLAYQIANATGAVPVVTTSDYIARGATGALGRSTVSGTGLLEKGFCWSTHRHPTILDETSTTTYASNGDLYLIQPLEPATVYYVRAYAVTKDYAVGYGEERKVVTLPMGNTTYWYNWGGSADENTRIDNALRECCKYYNNWSATTNFNISCSYGAGTPTADCSYGGSMRVGPNASYQRTGTILHESNHGVGIGTSSRWSNTALHDAGVWRGYRANRLLQFIENNPTATMKGDSQHMWPYGINGANEDTGSPLLYMANVMLTQAMHEDGIIPPGHGGCKPAYVFEQEDTVKYYITNEATSLTAGTGSPLARGVAYLTEDGNGKLVWSVPQWATATADDAYAWYTAYDPVRQLYTLRNARTGRYVSYANGFHTVAGAPTTTEYLHLMVARTESTLTTTAATLADRSYWILSGVDEAEPLALTAATSGATSSPRFDITDAATAQRWHLLTAQQVDRLSPVDEGILRFDFDRDNDVDMDDVTILRQLIFDQKIDPDQLRDIYRTTTPGRPVGMSADEYYDIFLMPLMLEYMMGK